MSDDELNAVMAERVMGAHHVEGYKDGLWEEGDWVNGNGKIYANFNPATDANDALRVVEALKNKGWKFSIDAYRNVVAFWMPNHYETRLNTEFEYIRDIPRAICEAAEKVTREGVSDAG
jgi:hypothetical protein